jgi:hypothetical protein
MAVVVIAAVAVRRTVLRDRARAIPVEAARERFRVGVTPTDATGPPEPGSGPTTGSSPASTAAAASAPSLSVPAPGVYRYRTVGHESIDALGGATHHYPEETTITVTREGCGVHLRWDALAERRDEWRLCVTPRGIELQPTGLQYHEFFGSADSEDVVCDRAIVLVPVSLMPPPSPIRQNCTLASDPWHPTWEVLEDTRRSVGPETIPVRHVRMTVDDPDDYWEHTVVDWYVAADGLPVQMSSEKSSRSPSPIGGVVYKEEYEAQLESLVPLR